MGLRSIAIAQGIAIPASALGKGKMLTQVVTILLLILGQRFLGPFYVLGKIALWITVALALISGADYFLKFYKKVARQLPSGSRA
jgi:CDP-diacylglycerol--glycerol-3-phosphate 3-phosphatidyltransferase